MRLISDEKAKDMIKNHRSDFTTEYDYRTARACINAVPSAQPEIIQCKDCKHRGETPIADGRYWCDIHDTFMYYCSDAERYICRSVGRRGEDQLPALGGGRSRRMIPKECEYLNWQYCRDLNDINKAVEEQDENWEGLEYLHQIISITYDTYHGCYVVFWIAYREGADNE